MSTITIYVEGGGNSAATKATLRNGMNRFLGGIKDAARARSWRWNLVFCGGRDDTYKKFNAARKNNDSGILVLLVDSEGPVDALPQPSRMGSARGEKRPHSSNGSGYGNLDRRRPRSACRRTALSCKRPPYSPEPRRDLQDSNHQRLGAGDRADPEGTLRQGVPRRSPCADRPRESPAALHALRTPVRHSPGDH